jgi:enamine deaminase RidA (YjgF/YER057c/UK114 family)
MARRNIRGGARFAPFGGFSGAVRVGSQVFVAGTTAVGADGGIVGPGDLYAQTKRVLEIIEGALAEAGASMSDVVQTQMFVTDVGRWEEAGGACEGFGDRPGPRWWRCRGSPVQDADRDGLMLWWGDRTGSTDARFLGGRRLRCSGLNHFARRGIEEW